MYFLQKQYDLISELERQLGLTDEDQSVALGQVNADNVIRRIRSNKTIKVTSFYLSLQDKLIVESFI